MNPKHYHTQLLFTIIAFLLLQPAWADTITTVNGSRISGEVRTINQKSVTVKTDFAGEITIDRSQIVNLTTEFPLVLKLMDGTEVSATTELTADGYLRMGDDGVYRSVSADELVAAWIYELAPPEIAVGPPVRRWEYTVAADINGRSGNSEEMGTMIRTEALREGASELKLYASVDRSKKNGEKSSDETIIGSTYVAFASEEDRWGWFLDGELERDEFESIDLRASASTGLSYRVFNHPDHSLQALMGLGYRHESYLDDTSDNTPTLNFSLKHALTLATWMQMTNTLSYTPSVGDFEDYLLVQDSGINMPIGDSDLSLRLGIKNNYNSEPEAGLERLDTIYYSRLLFRFD